MLPMVFDLFNTAQDAPKGQKVSTVANDFAGSIGSLMITMPLASAATYGLASLKGVEGTTFISKYLLKPIGKVFGMGLDKAANSAIKSAPLKGNMLKKLGNFGARWGGGILRLISIMFIFQPIFTKPVQAVIQKIFGKPYDKEAAEKAKELEAQKQIIPELGITQGELMEKIEKNPAAIQKLQSDPKLIQAMETNPKILLDLLDNKPINVDEIIAKSNANKGKIVSPANMNLLKNGMNTRTNTSNAVSKTPQKAPNKSNQSVDTATYIPSSAFVANPSSLSAEQKSKYDALMTRADKSLKAAERYI